MMNEQAFLAQSELKRTGKIRVIVQDNGSIHKSKSVQQRWSQWESMGLYLFFLPPYCSQMNPIEVEWAAHSRRSSSKRRLERFAFAIKTHELAGQMFDDELDLADALMSGVEARGIAGEYSVVRFRFNSS